VASSPILPAVALAAPWGCIVLTEKDGELWRVSFRLEEPTAAEVNAPISEALFAWSERLQAMLLSGCALEDAYQEKLLGGARAKTLSPFSLAVLRRTARIPCGTFLTYGALAASLGRPQAARAVGQALASNPFPILIPCHRVVSGEMFRHIDKADSRHLQGAAFGGKRTWSPIASWLRRNDISHGR